MRTLSLKLASMGLFEKSRQIKGDFLRFDAQIGVNLALSFLKRTNRQG
jgi:hypothetical protein